MAGVDLYLIKSMVELRFVWEEALRYERVNSGVEVRIRIGGTSDGICK